MLIEGGTAACTVPNVARRAGVERSTLYRRYPDRWALIVQALVAKGGADVAVSDCGCFIEDLKAVLRRLVTVLESPVGPVLVAAAGELRGKDGQEFTRTYFKERMDQLEPMFARAIERGELRTDVDKECLFSFAAGAIYFRMFIAARRVDEAFIDSVVKATCGHFCLQNR